MEYAIIILATGALCIGCFFVGAKVGQTVSKGEEIKMPTINPMEAYRQHTARQEAQAAQSMIDTVMHNVEVYDGTPNGQKDVPRG